MPDAVRFHFDPICPWCYQTSRWIHRLEELGEVDATWGLFSLELVNAGSDESKKKGHSRSGPSLRTAVLVREAAGPAGVGRFYAALGRRVHEFGEPVEDTRTIEAALHDAGLDTGLCEKAVEDAGTWERVVHEHEDLVANTRSFGVPTIVLEGGSAIFGPVISEPPADDGDAVELWRHVAWLARYGNFSELKRDRVQAPDLESVRQFRERRAS